MKTTYRKKTLESKLDELLPIFPAYNVIAFELRHDGEGWSVNTPFRIALNVDRETAISRLRGRWEVFKANYAPKAMVRDLTDIGCEENDCQLDVNCMAFAEVVNATI